MAVRRDPLNGVIDTSCPRGGNRRIQIGEIGAESPRWVPRDWLDNGKFSWLVSEEILADTPVRCERVLPQAGELWRVSKIGEIVEKMLAEASEL